MSYAEDMGYDAYEPQEPPDGWDDPTIWLDQNYNEIPLNELKTSHLQNIISGGARWWSQHDKLPALKKELSQRLNQTVSDNGHARTLHPKQTNDGGNT